MQIMKQLLFVLSGSLFAMLLLAGCGEKSEEAPTEEAAQSTAVVHQSDGERATAEAEKMAKEGEAKAKEMAAKAEAEAKKAMEDLQK